MVTPQDFVHGRRLEPPYKTPSLSLGGERKGYVPTLERRDHYTFLGNCPPTPPLSRHIFALSEK